MENSLTSDSLYHAVSSLTSADKSLQKSANDFLLWAEGADFLSEGPLFEVIASSPPAVAVYAARILQGQVKNNLEKISPELEREVSLKARQAIQRNIARSVQRSLSAVLAMFSIRRILNGGAEGLQAIDEGGETGLMWLVELAELQANASIAFTGRQQASVAEAVRAKSKRIFEAILKELDHQVDSSRPASEALALEALTELRRFSIDPLAEDFYEEFASRLIVMVAEGRHGAGLEALIKLLESSQMSRILETSTLQDFAEEYKAELLEWERNDLKKPYARMVRLTLKVLAALGERQESTRSITVEWAALLCKFAELNPQLLLLDTPLAEPLASALNTLSSSLSPHSPGPLKQAALDFLRATASVVRGTSVDKDEEGEDEEEEKEKEERNLIYRNEGGSRRLAGVGYAWLRAALEAHVLRSPEEVAFWRKLTFGSREAVVEDAYDGFAEARRTLKDLLDELALLFSVLGKDILVEALRALGPEFVIEWDKPSSEQVNPKNGSKSLDIPQQNGGISSPRHLTDLDAARLEIFLLFVQSSCFHLPTTPSSFLDSALIHFCTLPPSEPSTAVASVISLLYESSANNISPAAAAAAASFLSSTIVSPRLEFAIDVSLESLEGLAMSIRSGDPSVSWIKAIDSVAFAALERAEHHRGLRALEVALALIVEDPPLWQGRLQGFLDRVQAILDKFVTENFEKNEADFLAILEAFVTVLRAREHDDTETAEFKEGVRQIILKNLPILERILSSDSHCPSREVPYSSSRSLRRVPESLIRLLKATSSVFPSSQLDLSPLLLAPSLYSTSLDLPSRFQIIEVLSSYLSHSSPESSAELRPIFSKFQQFFQEQFPLIRQGPSDDFELFAESFSKFQCNLISFQPIIFFESELIFPIVRLTSLVLEQASSPETIRAIYRYVLPYKRYVL